MTTSAIVFFQQINYWMLFLFSMTLQSIRMISTVRCSSTFTHKPFIVHTLINTLNDIKLLCLYLATQCQQAVSAYSDSVALRFLLDDANGHWSCHDQVYTSDRLHFPFFVSLHAVSNATLSRQSGRVNEIIGPCGQC